MRGEERERVAELAHRGIQELHVGKRRAVVEEADHRVGELLDVTPARLVRLRLELAEELADSGEGVRSGAPSAASDRHAWSRCSSSSHVVAGAEQVKPRQTYAVGRPPLIGLSVANGGRRDGGADGS